MPDKPLTAEEGADRVAERHKARRKRSMTDDLHEQAERADNTDEESAVKYTCEQCGGHVFLVLNTFDVRRTVRETLPCSCGETDDTAVREYVDTRTETRVGRLKPEHWPDFHDDGYGDETLENEELEDLEYEVYCHKCRDDAEAKDWESEIVEDWEEDGESNHWEVRCADCDHEIEFGWSHPEGGRIWPCESSDFNPWKTFPESRFVDHWERLGWLRPRNRKPDA